MKEFSFVSLLCNLIFTVAMYAIFPLVYASARKEQIKAKSYTWICFGVNLAIMFVVKICLLSVGSDFGNAGPYFLWTYVFSRLGIKNLKSKGLISDEVKKEKFVAKPGMKRFICDDCGSTFTGWNKTCPACGSAGKVRVGTDDELKKWNAEEG